tara:strand:- start:4266 stop:6164 length:1899 start_codon:yes stop_codon:yes gene_type:complete
MQLQWDRSGHELCLVSEDGKKTIPSADEIYRVRFENGSSSDLPPLNENAMESLKGLEFSRIPARMEIHIVPKEHEQKQGLKTVIIVSADGSSRELDTLDGIPDHIILGDCWYPFHVGALASTIDLLREAGMEHPGAIRLRQYLELRKLAGDNPEILDNTRPEDLASLWAQPEDVPQPQFRGTLYPYQKEGLQWLKLIFDEGLGGILADEMGLGKTVQIIALMTSIDDERMFPVLIVAPTTLIENWRREIMKFSKGITPMVHRGPQRTGSPDDLRNQQVVITTYETLIRDESLFEGVDWKLMVLDEAQAIKNPGTERAESIKRIPHGVGIAVTGTPVENRLRDLWSIMDFALPGFLGASGDFEDAFSDSVESASELDELIRPVILRRRVSQVADDLPEKWIIPVALELADEEAVLYEQVREEARGQFEKGGGLAALTRLRQYCTHPSLVAADAVDDPVLASAKYARLVEIMEEIFSVGEKALIFTSYNGMIKLLMEDLRSRLNCRADFINGDVPPDRRQGIVDEFNNMAVSGFLALNPRAAGTGLNITGANHVIHYTLEWNPAVEDQATARAYRRGQEKPVAIHRLFYVDSVEEVIDQRLERKRILSESAITDTEEVSDAEDIMKALHATPFQ